MFIKAVAVIFFIIAVSRGQASGGFNARADSGWQSRLSNGLSGQWDDSNSGFSRTGAWGSGPGFRSGGSSPSYRLNGLAGDCGSQARSSNGWGASNRNSGRTNAW